MTGRATLRHPLLGADPVTLARVLGRAGGIPRGRRSTVAAAVATALARAPFSAVERLRVALGPEQPDRAPIFIVGHWRSGTTHLYNILATAPRFATVSPFATALPWDFLLLGRALRPLLERALPGHRVIDRVAVGPDSPQEDEIAIANMSPLSFYHALYFPDRFADRFRRGVFMDDWSDREVAEWTAKLRHFYRKLSIARPDAQLLIKNPVYTARIGRLRRIWPEARFIHIYRDPCDVFVSMRRFHHKLLGELALQDAAGVDGDAVVFETYDRMMRRLRHDTATLPEDRYAELAFEDLVDDPLTCLRAVFERLGLEGFEADAARFDAYLDSVRGYRRNRYGRTPEVTARVRARWGEHIERLGYAGSR